MNIFKNILKLNDSADEHILNIQHQPPPQKEGNQDWVTQKLYLGCKFKGK